MTSRQLNRIENLVKKNNCLLNELLDQKNIENEFLSFPPLNFNQVSRYQQIDEETQGDDELYTGKILGEYASPSCYCVISLFLVPELKLERLLPGYNKVNRDGRDLLEWEGANLVDLMVRLDQREELIKYQHLGMAFFKHQTMCNRTRFIRAIPEALPPSQSRASDSGFDLHLVKHIKDEAGVSYYTTGLVLIPPTKIWYALYPRSSMAKSGYVLANGVGILDSGDRSEVIVALRKIREDAPSIILPAKMIQIVPQQWIYTTMTETDPPKITQE